MALVCAWGVFAVARADDPPASTSAAPAPAAQHRPLLTPFPAETQSYLQEHPELAQPSTPADNSGLTLRPDASGTNAAPEVVPPGSGIFPDTFHESSPVLAADDLAAHLLVVYNTNDPDSKGLADYYSSKRNIPPERVLGISCPNADEITRVQYDDTIRSPIISLPDAEGLDGARDPARARRHPGFSICSSPPAMTSGPLC